MKGDKTRMPREFEFDIFDFSPYKSAGKKRCESSSSSSSCKWTGREKCNDGCPCQSLHENVVYGVLLNPPLPTVPVTPAVLTPGTPIDFTVGFGHCTIANGANDAIVILKPGTYRISGTVPVNGIAIGLPGATVTIVLGLSLIHI